MKQHHAQTQTIGAWAEWVNTARVQRLNQGIQNILYAQADSLSRQDKALAEALQQVEKVRSFLGQPEHILGRHDTKHGEIAEVIEVNIRNARRMIEQLRPNATFDGVHRLGPVDYLLNDQAVQSKFVNNPNKSLFHVLSHMEKYPDFKENGYLYHIPQDQYQEILGIANGDLPGKYAGKTIRSILSKVREIEAQTGQPFSEVVRPSISDYAEVQKGVVHRTVERHEDSLLARDTAGRHRIDQQADTHRNAAIHHHSPSMAEAVKVGMAGALIAGGLSVGVCIWKKQREGRNLLNFTAQDWADIGVDFSRSGGRGFVSGVGIYGLTNYTACGAPIAAAFVSAAFGLASLSHQYTRGVITLDQFVENSQVVGFDAAAVGLGAVMGQTLIPIPVIGTLIGSFATQTVLALWRNVLDRNTQELQAQLDRRYAHALNTFERAHRIYVADVTREFARWGDMSRLAFDFDQNVQTRLAASIDFATDMGVAPQAILRTTDDLDRFMLA